MNDLRTFVSTGAAALDDWTLLFAAVQARLHEGAGAADTATGTHALAQARLRTHLLDCADALAHLHQMLAVQAARQSALAQELTRAQTALAAAQAGSQAAAAHDGVPARHPRGLVRQRVATEFTPALAPGLPEPAELALAVLYLDLGGLHAINDQHGAAAGDELLRIVAARLARSVRSEDRVYLMGDNEFACLLGNELSRDQLSHLACKLFDAVSAPLKIGALELTVRPSIGIAVGPGDGTSTEALLRRADVAMMGAKRQQMGYAFFDQFSAT